MILSPKDGDEVVTWTLKDIVGNNCSGSFTPSGTTATWTPDTPTVCKLSALVTDPYSTPDQCGTIDVRAIEEGVPTDQWFKALNGNLGAGSIVTKDIPSEEKIVVEGVGLTTGINGSTDFTDVYAQKTSETTPLSYIPNLTSAFAKADSTYEEVPSNWQNLEPASSGTFYKLTSSVIDTADTPSYSLTSDGIAIVFYTGSDPLEITTDAKPGVGFKAKSANQGLIIISDQDISISANILGSAVPTNDPNQVSQLDAYLISTKNIIFEDAGSDPQTLVVKGGVVGKTDVDVQRDRYEANKSYPALVAIFDPFYLASLSSSLKEGILPFDFPLQEYNMQWVYED